MQIRAHNPAAGRRFRFVPSLKTFCSASDALGGLHGLLADFVELRQSLSRRQTVDVKARNRLRKLAKRGIGLGRGFENGGGRGLPLEEEAVAEEVGLRRVDGGLGSRAS